MTRVRVALAILIAAALVPATSIFVQVASNPELLGRRSDPISAFERRVAPLRDVLRGEQAVGYLASAGVNDRAGHLYNLRYALAPVQVFNSIDQALVVADGVADARDLPGQFRVRRDFGGGLFLLERAQ